MKTEKREDGKTYLVFETDGEKKCMQTFMEIVREEDPIVEKGLKLANQHRELTKTLNELKLKLELHRLSEYDRLWTPMNKLWEETMKTQAPNFRYHREQDLIEVYEKDNEDDDEEKMSATAVRVPKGVIEKIIQEVMRKGIPEKAMENTTSES